MDDARALAAAAARNLRARALFLGPRLPRAAAAPAPPSAPPAAGWDAFREEVLACTACGLCETRTQVVFGEGNPDAELVFVGEAPGQREDEQGRPFVGPAGQLLTKMIEAMGFSREDVFIANVLKCRPPGNRDPAPVEVEQCRPYLMRQLEHIRPKLVCALGRHALHALTGYEGALSRIRGRPLALGEWPVVATYHPAYLLRNPAAKAQAWDDLKGVLRLLGRPVPAGKKRGG